MIITANYKDQSTPVWPVYLVNFRPPMGVAAGWGPSGGLSAKLKDMCGAVYAHVHM